MPLTRHDPSSPAFWRGALWIVVIVGASLGFSRAFACATPFAALATLAGTQMRWRAATLAVVLAWLANQAIGFLLLGYPHTPSSFAWGAAIGVAALAALGFAVALARLPVSPVARLALAFVAAFAAYEGVLSATAIGMQSGTAAFAVPVVARIFAINAVALAGLALLHRLAIGTGLIATPPDRAPLPA